MQRRHSESYDTSDPHHGACRKKSRSRKPTPKSSPSVAEHCYQSPCADFNFHRLEMIVNQLRCIARPPVSLDEFRQSILGATEHEHFKSGSRSRSHFLSTMARSITAMLRTTAGNSVPLVGPYGQYDDFLPRIFDCARRIANKYSTRDSQRVIDKLYEFLRNRCDDAAVRIITDRLLESNVSPYTDISTVERELVATFLRIYIMQVDEGCEHIKAALGSS